MKGPTKHEQFLAVTQSLIRRVITGEWPDGDVVDVQIDTATGLTWMEGKFYTTVLDEGELVKSEPIYAILDENHGIILTDVDQTFFKNM